jgi:ubiquitin carboxyl-terminal hydrolase 25/28
MNIDDPTSPPPPKDREPMSPQRLQSSPEVESPKPAQAEASSSRPKDKDGDVKMDSPPLPPKPARKRTEVNDSGMMFGRQHDVAECMDNCMFQIETALLKFDDISEASDKLSIVKSLFYGKIRQRLTVPTMPTRASVHDKEDLFSHLPVNVTNDGIDIYDGLSGYFDDIVEFEGRKVRMEVTLVDLPPILQIQLQVCFLH